MAINEIINYIENLADEKKVSKEAVFLALEDAMKKAYEKEMSGEDENHPDFVGNKCEISIDRQTGKIDIYNLYTILDDASVPEETDPETQEKYKVYNTYNQILLSEAIKKDKNAVVGGIYKEFVDIKSLDRRVVLHMLQVFKHDINIESNKTVYKDWIDKKGTIIYAEVEKIDTRNRSVIVNLGSTFGVVGRNDQNPEDDLIEGAKYKFYIRDVLEQSKNWPVVLSRASGEIVKDLLINNIPELSNNTVSIVKVGRVAGFKSKVAVKSNQPGIDPIGACIGARADRIRPILNEMGAEKIEFVEYSDDINQYLVNACNPAPLVSFCIVDATYETNPETGAVKEITRKKIKLVVDDYKLALIIGSKGKNVRVLAELLDADVEVLTREEAETDTEKNGTKYIKAVHLRRVTTPTAENKPVVNKYDSIYNKYHNNNADVTSSIDQANEIVDDATIVDEPVVQSGEKVNDEDYAAGLDELNQITGDAADNKSEETDADKK